MARFLSCQLFVFAHYLVFCSIFGGRYQEVVPSSCRQAGKGESSACYVVVQSKTREAKHAFVEQKCTGFRFSGLFCLRQKTVLADVAIFRARPLRCNRKAIIVAGLGHSGLAICDPATMWRVQWYYFSSICSLPIKER